MTAFIAEYKVGKAAYWITEQGFVDNLNPNIPGIEIVYPWDKIYSSLEYETWRNPRTGMNEPALRWLRVYEHGGHLVAEMPIADPLRPAMIRFYEVFKETQAKATGKPLK